MTEPLATAGFTTQEVARRYRVSADKIRSWISRGELQAINTADALCSKPRWVVLLEHLAAFERRRTGGPPPKVPRRKRRATEIDFYPDGTEGGAR